MQWLTNLFYKKPQVLQQVAPVGGNNATITPFEPEIDRLVINVSNIPAYKDHKDHSDPGKLPHFSDATPHLTNTQGNPPYHTNGTILKLLKEG